MKLPIALIVLTLVATPAVAEDIGPETYLANSAVKYCSKHSEEYLSRDVCVGVQIAAIKKLAEFGPVIMRSCITSSAEARTTLVNFEAALACAQKRK